MKKFLCLVGVVFLTSIAFAQKQKIVPIDNLSIQEKLNPKWAGNIMVLVNINQEAAQSNILPDFDAFVKTFSKDCKDNGLNDKMYFNASGMNGFSVQKAIYNAAKGNTIDAFLIAQVGTEMDGDKAKIMHKLYLTDFNGKPSLYTFKQAANSLDGEKTEKILKEFRKVLDKEAIMPNANPNAPIVLSELDFFKGTLKKEMPASLKEGNFIVPKYVSMDMVKASASGLAHQVNKEKFDNLSLEIRNNNEELDNTLMTYPFKKALINFYTELSTNQTGSDFILEYVVCPQAIIDNMMAGKKSSNADRNGATLCHFVILDTKTNTWFYPEQTPAAEYTEALRTLIYRNYLKKTH